MTLKVCLLVVLIPRFRVDSINLQATSTVHRHTTANQSSFQNKQITTQKTYTKTQYNTYLFTFESSTDCASAHYIEAAATLKYTNKIMTNMQGQFKGKRQVKHCSLQKATRTFARLQHPCQFRNGCCSDLTSSSECWRVSKRRVASECENTELVWRLVPSISSVKSSGLLLSRLPVIFNPRASKGICGDKTIKDGAELTWREWCVPCCKTG